MSEILLIDAEQPFAGQMVDVLSAKGFSVKQLEDGKEGLEYARDHRPALIVLCVELPKMSGYSICNKLKKDGDLKGIPLIITSKEATPETFAQHKKLKTRAEDYLIKPFDDGALLEKIGGLIEMPAAPAGGAAAAPADDDGFDALDALDALDGEEEMRLEEADLEAIQLEPELDEDAAAGFDDDDMLASLGGGSAEPKADAGLAELDADDMLAGLEPDADDGLGALEPEADPLAGLGDDAGGDIDLGGTVQADDELASFEENFEAMAPNLEPAPPVAEPPPSFEPAPAVSATSAEDLQQLASLRRENTELKSKLVEIETRLKTSEQALQSAQAQLSQSQSSSSSTARDVLSLKEQLRNKDKDLERLKDEVFEHEKKVVEVQEELDKAKAELLGHSQATAEKDAEIASLKAKADALSAERDDLEKQVNDRLRTAEAERDRLRGEIESLKRTAAEKDELEKRVRSLEDEKQKAEDQLLKSYQRIKSEEALRERARKAAEIAFTLLSGDVDSGAAMESDPLDLAELDA